MNPTVDVSRHVVAAGSATKVAADDDIDQIAVDMPIRSTRSDSKLTVSPADLRELRRLSRSPRVAYCVVVRSRIVLELAAGASNREAAALLRVSYATVARWRNRYQQLGADGLLRDRTGRGRRARFDTTALLEATAAAARCLQLRGRRVSLRGLARELRISYSSLQRHLKDAGGLAISEPLDRQHAGATGNTRCTAKGATHPHKKDRS